MRSLSILSIAGLAFLGLYKGISEEITEMKIQSNIMLAVIISIHSPIRAPIVTDFS